MRDWERFVQHTPWFAGPGDITVTADETPWSRDPVGALPRLSALLARATVTTLSIAGKPYELFAWGPADRRCGWLCEPLPAQADDHCPVAVEANGNLTLVHRRSGRLLLFAPDHAFPKVTPLPGCPEYSLMTIDDLPDLASWIEECAAAWVGGTEHTLPSTPNL